MDNIAQLNVGFIGGGNMAGSLIGGLLASGHDKARIGVSEPDASRRENLERQGIQSLPDNQALAEWADILILAVKPQMVKSVIQDIAAISSPDHPLILSIAAGIPTESIVQWLGHTAPVIRVMPNTPALVGHGMSALVANPQASATQKQNAGAILQSVGEIVWLDQEQDMDIVTAISGSGPAYFFLLMEALIAAAIKQGLDQQTSKQLVLKTALGASIMATESKNNPEELRQQVTSPGGTTEQAIQAFLKGGLPALTQEAVDAAVQRAIELSRPSGDAT